jgi:hypothetical protein
MNETTTREKQESQEFFMWEALSTIKKLNTSYIEINSCEQKGIFRRNLLNQLKTIALPLSLENKKTFIESILNDESLEMIQVPRKHTWKAKFNGGKPTIFKNIQTWLEETRKDEATQWINQMDHSIESKQKQTTLSNLTSEETVWKHIRDLDKNYTTSTEKQTIRHNLVGHLMRLFSQNQLPLKSQKTIIRATMELDLVKKHRELGFGKTDVYKDLETFLSNLSKRPKETTVFFKTRRLIKKSTLYFPQIYRKIEESLKEESRKKPVKKTISPTSTTKIANSFDQGFKKLLNDSILLIVDLTKKLEEETNEEKKLALQNQIETEKTIAAIYLKTLNELTAPISTTKTSIKPQKAIETPTVFKKRFESAITTTDAAEAVSIKIYDEISTSSFKNEAFMIWGKKTFRLELLGGGIFSTTYRYVDGGKKYVLKISKKMGENPDFQEKSANPAFQQEAVNLEKIEGEDAGIIYIPGTENTPAMLRMPYKGLDAHDFFYHMYLCPFNEKSKLFAVYQFALSAIDHLADFHKKYGHGDIKLENMTYNEEGKASLIDFDHLFEFEESDDGDNNLIKKYIQRLDEMLLIRSIISSAFKSGTKKENTTLENAEKHLSILNEKLPPLTSQGNIVYLGNYYDHSLSLVTHLKELQKIQGETHTNQAKKINRLTKIIEKEAADLGLQDEFYQDKNLLKAIRTEAKRSLAQTDAYSTPTNPATCYS